MFKSNEIKFGDYFKLPNQGLRSYFGNVVKGQPLVYTAPFAKGESTQQLLKNWEKSLKSIDKEWPSLFKYEMEMKEKVGPLSVMEPLKARIPDIDAYYTGVKGQFTPIEDGAIKAALSEWDQARGLFIRDQRETLAKMKQSSNSGSPYFTKRRNVAAETVPCSVAAHDMIVRQTLGPSKDTYLACAVLGWRGQEGGYSKDDVKQRVVWMFPFAVNIEELRVYQPLIEAAQKFDVVPAWVSMENVDKHITKLFDTKGTEDLIVCTDFTAFDQHFNKCLQDAAKSMISGIFTLGQISSWLESVFPVKYMIPLAYDLGKVKYGYHGMGSGSGGTNADETLAHRCLQYEAARSVGERLNPHSMCLGDDGILSYPGITVDDVIASYTRHGLEMNTSKQSASTQDCIYLRRWHHSNYRVDGVCAGVYPTMRALGRLRYLERFMDPEVWGPKMVALRQLSILENVKYHPLREEFVEFCMKRDKYSLGIKIPGFLANIVNEAEKATAYMPDFLGYTKTLQTASTGIGIDSWWIVNYLKSRA